MAYFVLPLTFDESDSENLITWSRLGNAPDLTPDGFEGNGWNSRLKSTAVPSWLTNAADAVSLQASITLFQGNLATTAGETAVFMGADGSGTNPAAKIALMALADPKDSSKCYLGLQTTTAGGVQSVPLCRPEWSFNSQFPELTRNGYTVRPQGLLFLDTSTLLVSGHFDNTESVVYKIDVYTGSVLGSFSFGTSTHRHVASFAQNSSGDVWCLDYDTGHALQIDLDASFSAGSAVILADWNTSVLATVSGIDFVTVSGTEYVLIGEYASSGTPYLYVIPVSVMADGVTFATADRYKRFSLGLRTQGCAVDGSGNLWMTKNSLYNSSSNTYGFVEKYNSIASVIVSTADGATVTPDLVLAAPSGYPEDIKFHPVTGRIWTMTEGWAASGDMDGWLSLWESPLDGEAVENHIGVRYDGAGEFVTTINNREFQRDSFVPIQDVEVISIGAPPNVSAGFVSGFFRGFIRNIRIQDTEISSAEYGATVAGDFEPYSLTAYSFLLTNPGAESGSTTGWTAETGGIAVRTTNPLAYDGTYYFTGGAYAQTISRQRLNILAQTGLEATDLDAAIAAGKIYSKVKWHQSNYDSANDPGAMGLRHLDVSESEIDTTYGNVGATPNSTASTGPWYWYQLALAVSMPTGARYIDALIRSDRTAGTNNDSYFDDVEVIVYLQLEQEPAVLLQAVLSQLYDIDVTLKFITQSYGIATQLDAVALEQLYSVLLEIWMMQIYGDVPVVEKSLVQPYRGANILQNDLVQKWGASLEMEVSLVQEWAMPATMEPYSDQPYGIAAAVLQVISDQLYNINANTNLFADLIQPYAMAAETAALYIFDTKIFVDGERIPYITCDWQATKSEYAWHVEFSVKSLEVAIKCAEGAEILVTSAGDSYRFKCYDGWRLDKRFGETAYRIEAWSPTRGLDLAAPNTGDVSGMASEIVSELAAPHGITVDWQMADGYIADGKLSANSETPLAVIRKLVEDGGRGRLQTAADGMTLLCVCATETPVPDWPSVSPVQIVDARVERRATTWQNDIQPGYNLFTVSDQLAAGNTERLVDTLIDSRTADVRVYVTPLADAPGYTLEHKGGISVSIEPMGIVSETVTDELVAIQGGVGKTMLPIYGVVARTWQEHNLGDIVTSEDGLIQSTVAGYSLLRISYTTRFYQWIARDSRIEEVLFVARRND